MQKPCQQDFLVGLVFPDLEFLLEIYFGFYISTEIDQKIYQNPYRLIS